MCQTPIRTGLTVFEDNRVLEVGEVPPVVNICWSFADMLETVIHLNKVNDGYCADMLETVLRL